MSHAQTLDLTIVPTMVNHIMRFVREEEGASALEYGLLAALIAVAIIGAVTALGTTVSQTFTNINGSISVAAGSGSSRGS